MRFTREVAGIVVNHGIYDKTECNRQGEIQKRIMVNEKCQNSRVKPVLPDEILLPLTVQSGCPCQHKSLTSIRRQGRGIAKWRAKQDSLRAGIGAPI